MNQFDPDWLGASQPTPLQDSPYPVTHKVKSWIHLFQAAKSGVKTHDFRDGTERNYKAGDLLLLQEFDFTTGEYTGDELLMRITYVTDRSTPCALSSNGLAQNLCVLSITKETVGFE